MALEDIALQHLKRQEVRREEMQGHTTELALRMEAFQMRARQKAKYKSLLEQRGLREETDQEVIQRKEKRARKRLKLLREGKMAEVTLPNGKKAYKAI